MAQIQVFPSQVAPCWQLAHSPLIIYSPVVVQSQTSVVVLKTDLLGQVDTLMHEELTDVYPAVQLH